MQAAASVAPYSMFTAMIGYDYTQLDQEIQVAIQSFGTTTCASTLCDSRTVEDEECEAQKQCGNCAIRCSLANLCYSCSTEVCSTCMVAEEGCCLLCLETFPVSPSSLNQTSIALEWLITPALQPFVMDSDQALPFMYQGEFQQSPAWTSPACTEEVGHGNGSISKSRWADEEICDAPNMDFCQALSFMQHPPTECDLFEKTWSGHMKVIGHDNGSTSESTCLDDESDSSISSKPGTTMMICNIPCRVTHRAIIEAIDSVGYAGTYDFVYLPDRRQRGAHRNPSGNLGYAFVDFKTSQHAEDFTFVFENFQFPGTFSSKSCTVKYAHEQGFNANTLSNRRSKGNRSM